MINRQDAIDDLHGKDPSQIWDAADVEVWINELPSAQPERKKGKWIYKHCVWFCSECGENPTKGMGYVQGHQELYDFCPKCGADMRGEEL